jgi:hypothetical protein
MRVLVIIARVVLTLHKELNRESLYYIIPYRKLLSPLFLFIEVILLHNNLKSCSAPS